MAIDKQILEVVLQLNAQDLTGDLKKVASGADTISSSFDAAEKKVSDFGRRITSFGQSMSVGVTVPVLAAGGAMIKMASDFESGMNAVLALTNATESEFAALRQQALDLGESTVYSATESAGAMAELAKAGLDVNEVMGAMPATLTLAASGGIGIAESAKIATTVLHGFRLEVTDLQHVTDALAKTANVTNAGVTELGTAFSYVGPIAATAGADFNETTAALGLLHNAGLEGSMAGTALRGMFDALLNPTKQEAEALKALGINALDASGSLLPLHEIIGQLETSGAIASDFLQIFGQRAGPGMAGLVGQGSEALRALAGDITNAAGEAQRVADIRMEGFAGEWEQLSGAIETTAVTLADSGILELLTELIRDAVIPAVEWFGNLDPQIQRAAIAVAAFAAAIGPLLVVVGSLTTTIAVLGPTATAAIAVAAAATAAGSALMIASWAEIKPMIDDVSEAIMAFADFAVAAWDLLEPVFGPAWAQLWNDAETVATTVWNVLKLNWQLTLGGISTGLKMWAAIFRGDWAGAWELSQAENEERWAELKSFFSDELSNWHDWWETNLAILAGQWDTAWAGITGSVKTASGEIDTETQSLFSKVNERINEQDGLVGVLARKWRDDLVSAISESAVNISLDVATLTADITKAIQPVLDKLDTWNKAWDAASLAVNAAASAIESIISDKLGAALRPIDNLIDGLRILKNLMFDLPTGSSSSPDFSNYGPQLPGKSASALTTADISKVMAGAGSLGGGGGLRGNAQIAKMVSGGDSLDSLLLSAVSKLEAGSTAGYKPAIGCKGGNCGGGGIGESTLGAVRSGMGIGNDSQMWVSVGKSIYQGIEEGDWSSLGNIVAQQITQIGSSFGPLGGLLAGFAGGFIGKLFGGGKKRNRGETISEPMYVFQVNKDDDTALLRASLAMLQRRAGAGTNGLDLGIRSQARLLAT